MLLLVDGGGIRVDGEWLDSPQIRYKPSNLHTNFKFDYAFKFIHGHVRSYRGQGTFLKTFS